VLGGGWSSTLRECHTWGAAHLGSGAPGERHTLGAAHLGNGTPGERAAHLGSGALGGVAHLGSDTRTPGEWHTWEVTHVHLGSGTLGK
jgi:hypothetical protein